MDILAYSAVELARAIKAGETTAVEAMKAVLDRIDASEESIHAYVTIDREAALAKAEAVHGGHGGDHAGARDARHAEGACAHVWLPAECGGRRTH